MKNFTIILFSILLLSACGHNNTTTKLDKGDTQTLKRPNILLIVADDLGYSDLGSFGGDANTPNLDRLAIAGTRLTNFHTAPSCSPSRAKLLSGTDNHLVGLGNMQELLFMYPWQKNKPGYEGHLNNRALTISTVLRDQGYLTLMSGKWHMGHEPDQTPTARGFERSYALMQGTSSHFAIDNGRKDQPTILLEDGEQVNWPHGKYSSEQYTDKMLEYLKQSRPENQPFFGYLAYTAPHLPLHAPQNTIDKYKGKFDGGYQELIERRMSKMRALGVIPNQNIQMSKFKPSISWESLSEEERQVQSRVMEVYTAMIDEMDQNVGRVISYLRESGQLDNTLIIFLSDNGAAGVNAASTPMWKEKAAKANNSINNIGRSDSWVSLGQSWASAVTAPFRLTKQFTSEGGIRTPAFIWQPKRDTQGGMSNVFTDITDVPSTLIDYAGINLSKDYFSQKNVAPWQGRSLRPMLDQKTMNEYDPAKAFGWEHRERFALIKGDWKLLKLPKPYGTGGWELFNLKTDPGESHDLSSVYPERLSEMLIDWETYVTQNNVVVRE